MHHQLLVDRMCRWCLFGVMLLSTALPLAALAQPLPLKTDTKTTKKRGGYPIGRLPLVRFALQMLQHKYVDPTQLIPAKMYKASLLRLEQKLDGFRAEVDAKQRRITLRMGPHSKTLPQKKFLGLFDIWVRLRPVAKFIAAHHKGKMSLKSVEYHMVSGLLSTLDHQTQFVDPSLYRRRRRGRLRKTGKMGVMLSWRKGKLFLGRVVQDGPADQAGLKRGDQIVRIEGTPVVGGDIRKWISKIIGLRGTRLTLHVRRKGWAQPKRVVLIRAAVSTPNVTGHMLPGNIGYVRLRGFKWGSALAIREQLARLRREANGNLLGLILDLRHNGGGLVIEAVAICSLFVDKGVVTTYAGANTPRKTYKVSGTNLEERYPMTVLLDGYSASASELLSGALRNHQRAVVMGRQSYGKGTVQVAGPLRAFKIFYRMTIAQYMLPGEQSIQAVGVTPDVEILPVSLRKGHIRYYSTKPRDNAKRRKRWPSFLLQNMEQQQPSQYQLRYLAVGPKKANKKKKQPKKAKRRKRKPRPKSWFIDPTHPLGADFDVWFARYALANTKSGRRDVFLEQLKRPLKRVRREQQARIARAAKVLGLDWRMPRKLPKKQTTLQATATLEGKLRTISTNKPFRLRLRVKNTGNTTAYRVRGVLYADTPTLQYKEFLLGKIPPKRSLSKTLTLTLPDSVASRVDWLRFKVRAEGAAETKARLALPWRAPTRPDYAIAYHVQDPAPDGNGDGRLQPGERATLVLTLKNTSQAPSPKLYLLLDPDRLKTRQTKRRLVGQLKPNQALSMRWQVRVPDNVKRGKMEAHVVLYDRTLRHVVKHPLRLSIAGPFAAIPKRTKGWAVTTRNTSLYQSPQSNAPTLATLPVNTSLPIMRKWKGYLQVKLPTHWLPPFPTPKDKKKKAKAPKPKKLSMSAWLKVADVTTQSTGQPKLQGLKLTYVIQAPQIDIGLGKPPYSSKQATLSIPVSLSSSQGIRDVFVFQDKRKIFYKPVQYANPKGKHSLKVSIPVTLKPGINKLKLTLRTRTSRFHRKLYITYLAP